VWTPATTIGWKGNASVVSAVTAFWVFPASFPCAVVNACHTHVHVRLSLSMRAPAIRLTLSDITSSARGRWIILLLYEHFQTHMGVVYSSTLFAAKMLFNQHSLVLLLAGMFVRGVRTIEESRLEVTELPWHQGSCTLLHTHMPAKAGRRVCTARTTYAVATEQ
jgi:hypothetical protein